MGYTELVKRLREATGWKNASEHYRLMKEAADAIEELSRENESLAKSVNEASVILRKRWIPATERLPELFNRVIVYDKRWGVLSAMKGEDDSWGGRNDIVIEKVTHWMPLPELPEEETE